MQVHVAKLDEDFDIEFESLPHESVKYVIQYGLTQCINDAAASIQSKNFDTQVEFENAVRGKVAKRVDQLHTGDVPGSRAPADPEKAKARALALLKKMSPEDLQDFLGQI